MEEVCLEEKVSLFQKRQSMGPEDNRPREQGLAGVTKFKDGYYSYDDFIFKSSTSR